MFYKYENCIYLKLKKKKKKFEIWWINMSWFIGYCMVKCFFSLLIECFSLVINWRMDLGRDKIVRKVIY